MNSLDYHLHQMHKNDQAQCLDRIQGANINNRRVTITHSLLTGDIFRDYTDASPALTALAMTAAVDNNHSQRPQNLSVKHLQ